jgi:predicted Ser/Thr protein kinase
VSGTGELDDTVSSDSDAGRSPTAPATPATAAALPASISRFSIASKLGEGGMGIVMLATDPDLGRKVALKVLRDAGEGSERRQRFLREARAMAKVSHENVIVVHEVGTHEGRDYVAMEYVAGTTLARWQRGRSWQDVVSVYLRAGRGLAAAHAAGLVHRDFKPDNVLIGDDGRVRVTDFGLVAAVGDEPPRASTPPDMIASSLTHTGAVLGTPRFMAPEQYEGAAVDARADQFAFCVALYGALYRLPPFAGETYDELAASVRAGALTPPPASEVPAAIHAAIVRGLSTDRAQRFGSLDELLAVLSAAIAPPAARRRMGWTAIALGFAVVAIAIVAGVAYKLRADASRADARAQELAATVADLRLKTTPPPVSKAEAPPLPTGFKHAQIEFDDADAAFKAGRFAEATTAFLRSYEFAKLPAFLYNAGAAQHMLFKRDGDPAAAREAIALYRRYIAADPGANDRVKIEHTISVLEAAIAR